MKSGTSDPRNASAQQQFELFQDFLVRSCGIVLGDNKQYLVTSRLSRLMAEHGISDLGELLQRLQQFSQRSLRDAVVDAMTTNETLWFRDVHPFNIFRDRLLPELQRAQVRPLRVWSAACSSGQEPYSLSMAVEEYRAASMGVLRNPVEIVATDLSKSMLEQCRLAEYDQLSLSRGLSPERMQRYFEAVDGEPRRRRVKAEIRQRVRFQPLNLMDSFLSLGRFDVVFCRNVLIYFSADLKLDILRRMHAALQPGGYLVLGASESMPDVGRLFEMVSCSPGIVYRAIR
ncbi:MAG TPA: protein-glutamate O-methyltransferase CheR [Spongiibacteraceae bacterium]|nr:protein-glutamate O-methyltransferase CheR [Spongiibacteraceae bacterium]